MTKEVFGSTPVAIEGRRLLIQISELLQTILLTFAAAFSILLLAACGLCNNTVKSVATSPDGKWVATAVVRDCGATTDYSPQVHLQKPGKSVWGIGNVFIGDHSNKIQVKWLSATNLMIYSDCVVVKHVTNYKGIAITHEKKAPTTK